MQGQQITEAEYEVMNIVWEQPGVTSRTISDMLSRRIGWSNSTTKTLLRRLTKKGLLKTKKDGNRFLYSAAISEKSAVAESTEIFLSKICRRSVGDVLIYALQNYDVSSEDLAEIKAIIENKKANDNIECVCIPPQEP